MRKVNMAQALQLGQVLGFPVLVVTKQPCCDPRPLGLLGEDVNEPGRGCSNRPEEESSRHHPVDGQAIHQPLLA